MDTNQRKSTSERSFPGTPQVREAHTTHSLTHHDGLHSLVARDADPDVRALDHADVIGPIANGQGHHALVLLDALHDAGFLEWGGAAAENNLAPGKIYVGGSVSG